LLPNPGYCQAHQRETAKTVYDHTTRKTDPRLAEAKRFRDSTRWQRFREWFKQRHPLCCDPFGDHANMLAAVAQVHHVLPLVERPDLGLEEENCRPLCTGCHATVERMERAGKATAALFECKKSPPLSSGGAGAEKMMSPGGGSTFSSLSLPTDRANFAATR
jgi:hypothetical protein